MQVRSRIDAIHRNCSYTVLDDVKHRLNDLKGFKSEADFKRLYYQEGQGEVTVEKVLDPNSYFRSERCHRSVFNIYNKEAATRKKKGPKTTFGTYATRVQESQSAGQLRELRRERLLDYEPLDEQEAAHIDKAVQLITKSMTISYQRHARSNEVVK